MMRIPHPFRHTTPLITGALCVTDITGALCATGITGALCALVLTLTLAWGTSPALARPEMAASPMTAPDTAPNASSPMRKSVQERFTLMDADKNAQVSREEFFAAQPQMKEAAFVAIDADKDGAISAGEWRDFMTGHGRDAAKAGNPDAAAVPPARNTPGKTGSGPDAGSSPNNAPTKGGKPDLIMPPADPR